MSNDIINSNNSVLSVVVSYAHIDDLDTRYNLIFASLDNSQIEYMANNDFYSKRIRKAAKKELAERILLGELSED